MTSLDWPSLSADYAQYHRTAGNRLCHMIGIPLIVFSLVYWTRWPAANPVPLIAVALPLYFRWSFGLGAGMTLLLGVCSALSAALPAWTSWAAFLAGWIFQFAGHRIFERKSPAFMRNAVHLLVGPAWILREAIGMRHSGEI